MTDKELDMNEKLLKRVYRTSVAIAYGDGSMEYTKKFREGYVACCLDIGITQEEIDLAIDKGRSKGLSERRFDDEYS